MPLYGGIDLHANNSVIVLLNEQDQVIYQRRLANHLPTILEQLAPYHSDLKGVVVESTYNWYWLVDGLMEADYRVHLANPAAMQQYGGLKYTDDHSDARWLAHVLRLGVLPEGFIGFDHGVGHSLQLLYDAKAPICQKSNKFNVLGHYSSNTILDSF
jgi:transposase